MMTTAHWEDPSDLDPVRAPADDMDALAELTRRHRDFVFEVIARVVKDRTLAEDLAQEALLRACRGRAGFRGESSLRTWLYRIATNLAVNEVTRRREYPVDSVPDRVAATGVPESEVEAAELRSHLLKAIAELSEPLREPLILRGRGELTYREIAETTGLPLNTVRTRILRARRALSEQLEAWR